MTVREETEWQTRKGKIDIELEQAGWITSDVTKVIEEVDTKQSDFNARIYKTKSETLHTEAEKAYADYLLLDEHGDPLAVIEAKKTSKDPLIGQRQAEGYADDIKKQTGKDVFIFLTNGYEIWFWNRGFENPRQVKGFHSRADLERMRFQNYAKKDFSDVAINSEIIDRPYQIESVKRVLEGMDRGRRKFLIVQATGTGKTRVAMALIDVLLHANRAQKILFLADRTALVDQAHDENFKQFFPNESKTKVFSGSVDKTHRIYTSTIQTFMEIYRDFSVGDFDVIISDEAHRSIYNKWKDVFTYFDAVQIGLTATPSELIERDTFRFFDCLDGNPTALYTYENAINENYLAPYRVYDAQTHFQIEGIHPGDIPNEIKKKLLEEGIEEDELVFEGTDIEKKVIVKGTNEAIIREFMDHCLMDQTGTAPAKTIIFAISKKHAKRLWETFERLYPEYKGKLVRMITSEDSRAKELVKEFKNEEQPSIAISVDMLDTGIDVPEVCNLVFAKPVFSKIKFWQMIGRGTRHYNACKHKDWLPTGKKEYFLVFDFWKNFEWFDMHPRGVEAGTAEALPTTIFMVRIQQYNHFLNKNDSRNAGLIRKRLIDDIKSLPKDSIAIKERLRDIELVESEKLWDTIGIDPIVFLKTKIAPLMKYKREVNLNTESFRLKCERLALALLRDSEAEVERLKDEIGEYLNSLPRNLNDVRQKEELLDMVLSKSFWNNVKYDDVINIMNELSPLMKYKRSEPNPPIVLDIDDVIQERTLIQYGPIPNEEYVETYQAKVEKRIKELADKHPTIQKIKKQELLTEDDLQQLERTLNSPELYVTEENLQKIYKQHKGTMIQFIKKILGLYEFPDPKQKIADAFKTFVVEKNYLNADQVNFIRTLQTVFERKQHVEFQDFFESPFTNFGANAPIPLFDKEELEEMVAICKTLEKEVFAKR